MCINVHLIYLYWHTHNYSYRSDLLSKKYVVGNGLDTEQVRAASSYVSISTWTWTCSESKRVCCAGRDSSSLMCRETIAAIADLWTMASDGIFVPIHSYAFRPGYRPVHECWVVARYTQSLCRTRSPAISLDKLRSWIQRCQYVLPRSSLVTGSQIPHATP